MGTQKASSTGKAGKVVSKNSAKDKGSKPVSKLSSIKQALFGGAASKKTAQHSAKVNKKEASTQQASKGNKPHSKQDSSKHHSKEQQSSKAASHSHQGGGKSGAHSHQGGGKAGTHSHQGGGKSGAHSHQGGSKSGAHSHASSSKAAHSHHSDSKATSSAKMADETASTATAQKKGKAAEGAQKTSGAHAAKVLANLGNGKAGSGKAGRSLLESGDTVCREVACEGLATSAGYCRLHYIKNWKKIKRKEIILKEGKLNQYIEELVAKYPDKYIEAIRQDLANDKDFAKVIYDLDLDESLDDFDGEGSGADNIIDSIKRDFDDEGDSGF